MKSGRIVLLIAFVGFINASCARRVAVFPSSSPAPSAYDEDLSLVRPRYKEVLTVEPSGRKPAEIRRVMSDRALHINHELDAVLDTIAINNRSIRYANGYRIQIYVGNERRDADAAKLFTYQSFPEILPYVSFSQPTYRVKVGDFMTRIDAERYLQQFRQQFAAAVIQPDRIEVRKSILVK